MLFQNSFFYLTSLCFLTLIIGLAWYVTTSGYGFDSDEYLHATPPLDLAQFVLRGDWTAFSSRLAKEVFYPPLHTLVLTPFFLLFGPSVGVARLPSLLFFLFAAVFSARAVREISKNDDCSLLGVGVALLFAMSCPIAFLISTLVMLEPLGMMLLAMLLWCFCRERAELSVKNAFWVGMILSLLMLTKHSFVLLVVPGLVVCSVLAIDGDRAAWWKRQRWTGVALISSALVWGGWLLMVNSQAVYRFLFGHHARGYIFGVEVNLFYFQSLLQDFHLITPLGWVGVGLAIAAIILRWDLFAVRVSSVSLVLSFIAFGFIAERGPRHVVLLAPYWWFLVGVGFIALEAEAQKRYRSLGVLPRGVPLILLTLSVVVSLTHLDWYHKKIAQFAEAKPDQDELMSQILSRIEPAEPYTLSGAERLAFPYHLSWLLAARDGLTVPEARRLRKGDVGKIIDVQGFEETMS